MYGTMGTPTTEALADAVLAVEGGAGVAFTPSGLAAVTLAILTASRAGGHLLVPDSVYGPTRDFCDTTLRRLGVTTEYYDPQIGAGIGPRLRTETCALFLESPGSYTFEVQDVPAMVQATRAVRPDVTIIMDNAWGSPGLFAPLARDVDISVVPLTKYWGGHSDLLAGAVVAAPHSWDVLHDTAFALGVCTNGDEAWLALRGARTVENRLRQHESAALEVAGWLASQARVGRVFHLALPDCPGHEIWRRDFTGSNGLFSFELLGAGGELARVAEVADFVDRLVGTGAFGLGYSWGGFESLAMPAALPGGPNIARTVSTAPFGHLIRLHVGLEPIGGLLAALKAALAS
jgi:cystathionine beta-lyase